jgi:hypothetical protein
MTARMRFELPKRTGLYELHIFYIKMQSTLTGILESAERIGKAQAALELAKDAEFLKYTTEEAVTKQCIRNSFYEMVQVRYCMHPVASQMYEPTKHAFYNDLMLTLIDKALQIDSWTFGDACAWFSGETEGYHYNAFFKAGATKPGFLRITVDEIAHTCRDCSL